MLFLFFTVAFLIISTIFVYRTAKGNGYNAILWSILSVAVFIGMQFLFGLVYGIILIIAYGGNRASAEDHAGLAVIINLVSLAAGVAGVLLILRRVNLIKDEEIVDLPPPPTFERND